jgi:hypothetical protein
MGSNSATPTLEMKDNVEPSKDTLDIEAEQSLQQADETAKELLKQYLNKF